MQINISKKPFMVQQLEFIDKVDRYAGEVRARFITTQPGQELTYLLKLNEAKAYPNGDTAFITAEALATGKTEQEVVDNILASASLWQQIGTVIESERLKAKAVIKQATTVKEMYDAYASMNSVLEVL